MESNKKTREEYSQERQKARKRRSLLKKAAYPADPQAMIDAYLAAGGKVKVLPPRYSIPSPQGSKDEVLK